MCLGWIKISSSLSHRIDIYSSLSIWYTVLFCVFCLPIWLPPIAWRISRSHVFPFLCPSVDPQFLSLAHSMYLGNVYVFEKLSDEWVTWLMGVLQGVPHGRGVCVEEGAWGAERTEGRSVVSRTHSGFLRKHYQRLSNVEEMMHLSNIVDHDTGYPCVHSSDSRKQKLKWPDSSQSR